MTKTLILAAAIFVLTVAGYGLSAVPVERRFEPLNTNLPYFWIYMMDDVLAFPLESNLNIDKNRST
jgi:hypothetical protein